jgi:hypothetical protein
MSETTYKFTIGDEGMVISASYDTGWNDSLNCGGVGGWSGVINSNSGTYEFYMKSIKSLNGLAVKSNGKDFWTEYYNSSRGVDGYTVTIEDNTITVIANEPQSFPWWK